MIRAQTAENVLILVGLQWFNRGLGVVTKIVLARLLMPEDFGAFALAAGLIGFIGTFGNFGLDYAIIQKGEGATEADYDVGMSYRLLIGLGLFTASFVAAGPWASLFRIDALAPATRILALVYLVTPWSFVPSVRLVSELRYRTIAIPTLVSQMANATISIGLAVAGFGLWSLVFGLLVSQALATLAYSALRRWRFRFSLRRETARPLFSYGKHLVAAALLAFLVTNIDNFAVGFFLGSAQLGLYTVAYGFGFLSVSLLSSPVGSALFPSLTKIQERTEALRRGYLESFGYAFALIAPTAVGMAVLAPELVRIVLGPMWEGVIAPLVLLAFYGLFRSVVDFSSSLFAAVGKPRITAVLNLYILVGSLALLFPLTLGYGIVGTAAAMTLPVAVVALVALHQASQILGTGLEEFLSRVRGPLLSAGAMGVLVWAFRGGLYSFLPERVAVPFLDGTWSAVSVVLFAMVPFGPLAYLGVLRLVDPNTLRGIRGHLTLVIRQEG